MAMKHFMGFLPLLAICACNNSGVDSAATAKAAKDTASYTMIEWTNPKQNLDTLTFGEKTEIKFHFQNTGTTPLFIVSAEPGCGCTVADFPKGAVAPGNGGDIVAEFDTKKSHPGHFNKPITVTTNTKGTSTHMLTFEGEIKDSATRKIQPNPTQ